MIDHKTVALHMYWREHAHSIGLRSKLATSTRYWAWRSELHAHPELPAANAVAAITAMLVVFDAIMTITGLGE